MGFWGRIFGKDRGREHQHETLPKQAGNDSHDLVTVEVLDLINHHFDRLERELPLDQTMSSLIGHLRKICRKNAPAIIERMSFVLREEKIHSFSVLSSFSVSDKIFLVVTALACKEAALQAYFSRTFHPGYLTGYIQQLVNSDESARARRQGCTVFANLVINTDPVAKYMKVYLTLTSFGDGLCTPILPQELLSAEELRKLRS